MREMEVQWMIGMFGGLGESRENQQRHFADGEDEKNDEEGSWNGQKESYY